MVVAALWGTELIQFIAVPAILHQDDLKKGMNSSYSSYRPGTTHPFIQIVLMQNRERGKDLNQFWPPSSVAATFALFYACVSLNDRRSFCRHSGRWNRSSFRRCPISRRSTWPTATSRRSRDDPALFSFSFHKKMYLNFSKPNVNSEHLHFGLAIRIHELGLVKNLFS